MYFFLLLLFCCLGFYNPTIFFSLIYCLRNQQCTLLFEEHERQFQRLKKSGVPPAPRTIDDVLTAFERPDIFDAYAYSKHTDGREKFLDYIHKGPDFNYMIFSSKRIMALINEHIEPSQRKYLIDGTFYISPYGSFKQVLMIHLQKFDTVHPFIYVLMDVRTAAAYTHIFQYIHNNIFDLTCKSFTTDFEKAMRNALRCCFPNAELIACWFHQKQAVRRKATKFPVFFHTIRTNERAAHLYQKFQAIALLSPAMITPAFNKLKDVALQEYADKFRPFVDYYERQWIKNVIIFHFCAFFSSILHTCVHLLTCVC